jgi:hypothetical protein
MQSKSKTVFRYGCFVKTPVSPSADIPEFNPVPVRSVNVRVVAFTLAIVPVIVLGVLVMVKVVPLITHVAPV